MRVQAEITETGRLADGDFVKVNFLNKYVYVSCVDQVRKWIGSTIFSLFVFKRVIDWYVTTNCGRIDDATLARIIDLCITEMMKSPNPLPFVQSPSLEILVSIGRLYCAKVMDALSAQLQPTQVAHFMIMNCMGTLATANINGIISLIKPTLETILPHLSIIKLDHVKLSYAFGE